MKQIIKNFRNNKILWQIVLAILLILMCIYFIKNEHLEFVEIKKTLQNVNPFYLFLGLFITFVYIVFQGLMYVFSFRTVGTGVGFKQATQLFLKRNVLSVFLPAGGFSSLAFFTRPLKEKGISQTDIYYGSSIYGLSGMLSVAIVAVPVIFLLFLKNKLTSNELIPFVILLLIIGLIVFIALSFLKKKKVYRLLYRFFPGVSIIIDDITSTRLHKRYFFLTILISVFIEFIGVAHIYISMLALGFQPTLYVSFLAYLIMVMLLILSPFLRGIGAIEVSMTYVLIHNGIPAVGAAAITLLFRFFEFWMPLISGLGTFFFSKKNALLRVLPAFFIFVTGLMNILSVITPAIPYRLEILNKILPDYAVSISNYTVIIVGLLLIVLALYLARGVKRAWRIAMFLLIITTIGHITKGIDYEEAGLTLIAIMSLLFTHKYYTVKSIPLLRTSLWRVWSVSFLSTIIFAIAGTYFLEQNHMNFSYNFVQSVRATLRLIFLFDASMFLPQTIFAKYFISSIQIISGFLFVSGGYLAIKPIFHPVETESSENVRNHAKLLVEKYGNSALDYFKYYPDKQFYFSDDGFLAYKTYKNFAVVLELPVCQTDEQKIALISKFEKFARSNGLETFYFRIPENAVEWFKKLDKKLLFIGQEAILNLETFSLRGSKMHPIRNAISKAKRLGYNYQVYLPPITDGIIQKLKQVSDEWLSIPGKSETRFSQGIFLPELIKNNPIITIENGEGKIVAFLNIIPDYEKEEGTYDLIRTTKDAPTGIIYFLLIELFEWLKQQGIYKVNMGMVAFAGIKNPKNMTERTIKFALDKLKNLNYFKGQYLFKEKFKPQWVNKYLAYNNDYNLVNFPRVLKAISKRG